MMSKNSPELRFQGFTDDWEQRKLGEVVEGEIKGKAKANMQGNRSIYLETEYLNGGETTFVDSDADVEEDDILILWDGSQAGTVYHGFFGALGSTLKAYRPKESGKFVYYQLVAHQEMIFQRYRTPNIPHVIKTFTEEFSVFTTSLPEQERIGNFFKQLDNIIALHQRKLDLLKEQKKGFLQKMFPKNGDKVPEVRFAGFADDWEERKLSDVANHRGGTAIEKYFDKDGVYKVISIGSYGLNSQYVDQNIRAISNENTDGQVVNSGELTMVLNDKTANGTIIGRTLLVEKDNEYVINQRTEIISPKENFDSNFAYTILNGPFREKVKRIVQGGTQIYVNYPAVSNLNLELPKIEEQQKIGSFFKQLDDTITLHQRMLDLLKVQKKGFLQKMFV